MSKHFSDETFRPISHHRTTEFPGGGYAQPARLEPVGEPEQRKATPVDFDALVVNFRVFGPSANTLAELESGQCLLAADRELLPTLGATALQDETAVLAGHANEESVRFGATARIRLKCALTLHDNSPGVQSPAHSARALRHSLAEAAHRQVAKAGN